MVSRLLQHLIMPNTIMNVNFDKDFRVILICNAYSTNQEFFARPINILVDSLSGNGAKAVGAGSGNSATSLNASPSGSGGPANSGGGAGGSGVTGGPGSNPVPLSMVVLDNLTVHSKMSLIHGLVTQMIKQSQCKGPIPTPALVETYARLMVYTEIESLGIKGFLCKLKPH